MPLETGTTIDDLDLDNPVGITDLIGEGDDHMRLLKAVLQETFQDAAGDPWEEGILVNPEDFQGGFIPVNGVIMWSGTVATIPTNWALCDGTSGTPDLRDQFIAGAFSDDSGVAKATLLGSPTLSGGAVTDGVTPTGTSESYALIEANLPTDHVHLVVGDVESFLGIGGSPAIPYPDPSTYIIKGNHSSHWSGDSTLAGTSVFPTIGKSSLVGSSVAHSHSLTLDPKTVDTIPTFYALAYIKRIA